MLLIAPFWLYFKCPMLLEHCRSTSEEQQGISSCAYALSLWYQASVPQQWDIARIIGNEMPSTYVIGVGALKISSC